MLRLIIYDQTPAAATVAVQGKIAGADVDLLAAEGRRLFQGSKRLVLVLDGVQFIDEAGIALLALWSGPRLDLSGGSTFIRALLRAKGLPLA